MLGFCCISKEEEIVARLDVLVVLTYVILFFALPLCLCLTKLHISFVIMASSIFLYSISPLSSILCAFRLDLSPFFPFFFISRNYIRINVAALDVFTFYSGLQIDGSNLGFNFISLFPQRSLNSNCEV